MAKRKREVYPTGEIAHLWAHQAQPSARNPQGNYSFRGKDLYSYSTVIASLTKGKGGAVVALHANRAWSSTTAGHQSDGRGATRHLPSFSVADWTNGGSHKTNLANYKARIVAAAEETTKAREQKGIRLAQLDGLIEQANLYSRTFGLGTKFEYPADFDIEAQQTKAAEFAIMRAERQLKRDTARSEKWKAQLAEQEAKEAQDRAEAPANLQRWLDGQSVQTYSFSRYIDGTFARIVGAEVQTTQGAVVPLDHIRRVMPIVRRLYERGETYQANGHTIHLGHYQIDSIAQDGTLRAGCHTFPRAEVERLFAAIDALPAINVLREPMDDINDGGENNPAQFSTDNA